MREIKFRAWDKDENEMIYGINECLMNWDSLKHNVDRFLNMPSHLPVMQFTGLKDKNGKDIWEGDILENSNIVDADGTPYRIEVKQSFKSFESGMYELFYCYGFIFDEDPEEMKIIGNIYENPELLAINKEV